MHSRLRTLLIGIVSLPAVASVCYGVVWLLSRHDKLAMFAGGVVMLIGTIVLMAVAMTPAKNKTAATDERP